MSSDPIPKEILPTARQVIVCRDIHFDPSEFEWLIAGPLSVQFLGPGVTFPFREERLAVYTQLVGGLGSIQLGVEVRQRTDLIDGTEVSFRVVGTSLSTDPYTFPGGLNRLAVHELAFRFTEMPFEHEGTYEFRIVALSAEGEVPLEGGAGAVTYLSSDRGDTGG